MKKYLLSTVSLVVLVVPALAADLPSRKETVVPPVAVPLWQGLYAGLNAGYGFGTANNAQNYGWGNQNGYFVNNGFPLDAVAFAGANSYLGRNVDQGGFIGGGQVGYNYQHGQSFVIGFEADMQGSGISGQGNVNGWAPYDNVGSYLSNGTVQAGISWMGTARGRIGYLITPTVLAYATGGLAYGGTYLKTFPNTYDVSTELGGDALRTIWTQNSQQNFNVGWTAGAGAEWMMFPNWSIKGEALYYDLGNTSVSNTAKNVQIGDTANDLLGGSTTRAYYQGVIARAGVNYHFNLGSISAVTMPVLSDTALTDDFSLRKEANTPPAAALRWQGFYAGLNAGYGFGAANNAQQSGWANPAAFTPVFAAAFAGANSYMGRDIAQGGFIGGGQVGYSYQYGQNFLFGFEADMQGAGISGQGTARGIGPASTEADSVFVFGSSDVIQAGINWMGTARGRMGYLIAPTVMMYVTGGLAYGGTYLKTFPTTFATDNSGYVEPFTSTENAQQNFNVGWTAGGGTEWMMAPNWSIKGEALYYDLGSTSVSNTHYVASSNAASRNPFGGSTTRAYYQGVIARAGVNYHFNLGSLPLVAKF